MNVLHVIPSLKKGGAERLALDICRELQEREGINVKLLLMYAENEYRFLSESLDVEVTPSFYRFHVAAKAESDFTAYRDLVHRFAPDVIHSHLFEAEFFTRQCLFPGVKYITHLHDNMVQFTDFGFSTLLSKSRFTRWMEKRHLLKCYQSCNNTFIANSEDTAAYFRQQLPANLKHRIAVLENAIDLSRFRFITRKLSGRELRLVTTGSLVEKKNHAFLIGVMQQLKSQGYDVVLHILGDGPLHARLQEEINRSGLKEEIILAGNVHDVEKYLHDAQVYVHAATYEPFGLALVEAMATGLPVVSLDGKGNRGIVDDGINGYMLKEPDAKLFAMKVLEIIKSPEDYHRFSCAAGTKAQRYSINAYADQLISHYRNPFFRP